MNHLIKLTLCFYIFINVARGLQVVDVSASSTNDISQSTAAQTSVVLEPNFQNELTLLNAILNGVGQLNISQNNVSLSGDSLQAIANIIATEIQPIAAAITSMYTNGVALDTQSMNQVVSMLTATMTELLTASLTPMNTSLNDQLTAMSNVMTTMNQNVMTLNNTLAYGQSEAIALLKKDLNIVSQSAIEQMVTAMCANGPQTCFMFEQYFEAINTYSPTINVSAAVQVCADNNATSIITTPNADIVSNGINLYDGFPRSFTVVVQTTCSGVSCCTIMKNTAVPPVCIATPRMDGIITLTYVANTRSISYNLPLPSVALANKGCQIEFFAPAVVVAQQIPILGQVLNQNRVKPNNKYGGARRNEF